MNILIPEGNSKFLQGDNFLVEYMNRKPDECN